MSNAVFYCSYQLKKGASVPDFLLASEKLNNSYISKQKGYISWKQLADGEMWADFLTFETMEDVKNFEAASTHVNEFAEKFYSFINLNSCKTHYFSVEKSY
jgi:S-methylmethionine-dependent homocysteine/selenocysteine methylase